jgi:hypothetical protein
MKKRTTQTQQKLTQRQQDHRDAMIEEHGGKWRTSSDQGYSLGTRHYVNLSVQGLCELVDKNFACPHEKQNDGPEINDLIDFAMKIDELTDGKTEVRFGGYTVERYRSDCRVSVDDIVVTGALIPDVKSLFYQLLANHHADDFRDETDHLYAWWD